MKFTLLPVAALLLSGAFAATTTTTKTSTTKTSTTKTSTTKTSTTKTSTTKTTKTSTVASPTCTVTDYASISSAVKSCTNIILSNISAPPSSTINLEKLQTSAVVTFAGDTVSWAFPPLHPCYLARTEEKERNYRTMPNSQF